MRINPISVHQSTYNKSFNTRSIVHQETPETAGSVSFKSATAKCFGLGAFLGAVTVTLLSGGAAAPAVIAAYSALTGTASATIGHAIDKTKDDK